MARSVVFAVFALNLAMFHPAQAGCGAGGVQWLWSPDPVVARSTQALATGRAERAELLAETALKHGVTGVDARIAKHNLCLAHIALGGFGDSDPACEAALEAPADAEVACRGGLSGDVPHPAGSLGVLISDNIAAAAGHRIQPLSAAAALP